LFALLLISASCPSDIQIDHRRESQSPTKDIENGICESNEACIYAPNVGAYQGHGDYKGNGTCLFVDGTISNVIMYSYPKNGKE
jgi:hypothetical protein